MSASSTACTPWRVSGRRSRRVVEPVPGAARRSACSFHGPAWRDPSVSHAALVEAQRRRASVAPLQEAQQPPRLGQGNPAQVAAGHTRPALTEAVRAGALSWITRDVPPQAASISVSLPWISVLPDSRHVYDSLCKPRLYQRCLREFEFQPSYAHPGSVGSGPRCMI